MYCSLQTLLDGITSLFVYTDGKLFEVWENRKMTIKQIVIRSSSKKGIQFGKSCHQSVLPLLYVI
jgi:hypothetical protein